MLGLVAGGWETILWGDVFGTNALIADEKILAEVVGCAVVGALALLTPVVYAVA